MLCYKHSMSPTYFGTSVLHFFSKGPTSFLHIHDVCQNKHQTGSKEVVCISFPTNMLLYLTGSAGCRCHQLHLFCCFYITLHPAHEQSNRRPAILFSCHTGKPRLYQQLQYSRIFSDKLAQVSLFSQFLLLDNTPLYHYLEVHISYEKYF
jgi:hypothetical protein